MLNFVLIVGVGVMAFLASAWIVFNIRRASKRSSTETEFEMRRRADINARAEKAMMRGRVAWRREAMKARKRGMTNG